MNKFRSAICLICAVGTLSSCANKAPVSMATEHVERPTQPAPAVERSKYSARASRWIGDDYKKESLTNPGTDLPQQSSYTVPNPRTHFLQSAAEEDESNGSPGFLPLVGWENIFRAGELALDSLDFAEAEKMFRLAESVADKEAEPDRGEHKALNWARLAYLSRKEGDVAAARQLYEKALTSLEKDADKFGVPIDVILHELALMQWKQKNLVEAEKLLAKRVSARERQHGSVSLPVGSAVNDLANCLFYQKQLAAADKLYMRALIIAQRFKDEADDTIFASYNLANCRYQEHAFADALELYGKSNAAGMAEVQQRIEYCKQQVALLPPNMRKAQNLPPPIGDAKIWAMLAEAAREDIEKHREWDVRTVLSAALTEAAPFGKTDERYGQTLALRGDFSFARGDIRDALNNYEHAQPILMGATSVEGKTAASHYAERLLLCKLVLSPAADQSALVATMKKMSGRTSAISCWAELTADVDLLFKERRFSGLGQHSLDVLQEACAQLKAKDSASASYAVALANLARAYSQSELRDTNRAESFYKMAIGIADKSTQMDDKNVARMASELGQLYLYDQNYSEAEPLYKRALAVAERRPGVNNRDLLNAVTNLKYLYSRWDRDVEEELYLNREVTLRGHQSARQSRYDDISQFAEQAEILQKRENYLGAADAIQRVMELKSKEPNADLSTEKRTLMLLYQKVGLWDKVEELHNQAAAALSASAGNERSMLTEQFLAASATFNQGKYDKCAASLQQLIEKLEAKPAYKGSSSGCVADELRYSTCLSMLGNCKMDGFSRYDEAVGLFQKAGLAESAEQNSTMRGPSSDNRVKGGAGLVTSQPVLSPEQQLNFVICYDQLNDKGNADKYRQQLAATIQQTSDQYARNHQVRSDSVVGDCKNLINQTHRAKEEQMKLMALVAKSLHVPGVYSGRTDDAELLKRVVAWKTSTAGRLNFSMAGDLQDLCQIYIDSRQFDAAEPFVIQLVQVLRNPQASATQRSVAESFYGDICNERGRYKLAILHYGNSLAAHGAPPSASDILIKMANCFQALQQYDHASDCLEKALVAAGDRPEIKRDVYVRLGVIDELRGQTAAASKRFEMACANEKEDCYALLEPVRQAESRMASAKRYALAEKLYRREANLLVTYKGSPVGIYSAWTQMARMFKEAKRPEDATAAYRQALEVCRDNSGDTFLKSQQDSLTKELHDLQQK